MEHEETDTLTREEQACPFPVLDLYPKLRVSMVRFTRRLPSENLFVFSCGLCAGQLQGCVGGASWGLCSADLAASLTYSAPVLAPSEGVASLLGGSAQGMNLLVLTVGSSQHAAGYPGGSWRHRA